MRTFVEPQHVETQVFDWGRIQWLSEPRVTGALQITAGVVTLNPGQGHARHNHPGVEEVLYILEGEGDQMVDDGEPFRWRPLSMVYPVSERLRTWFARPEYRALPASPSYSSAAAVIVAAWSCFSSPGSRFGPC